MKTIPTSVVKSDNLKAFRSGIGSGLDLKIEKQLEQEYLEDFNVVAQVNGIYRQETKEYLYQPFQYRVKATGNQTIKVSEGFIEIQAAATPVHLIKATVSKMVAIPVEVRIRIKFNVEYFVRAAQGVEARNKTLYTDTLLFRTEHNRLTVDQLGTVAMLPYTGQEINATTIQQYLDTAIQKDKEIVASIPTYGITTYGYEIEDDYPFDLGNPYRKETTRTFQPSSVGSFNVVADYVDGKLDLNSKLKVFGVANAGLFSHRKTVEREVSIHDGDKVTLMGFNEFKALPLVNVDDPTYLLTDAIYNSSNAMSVQSHLSQIENPQGFNLYTNAYHNITKDDFLVIEPKGQDKTNRTAYRFDDKESFLNVTYYKLIPTIGRDPLRRYHYQLTVTNCSSNIAINNKLVKPQQVIRSTGTGVSSFSIVSRFKEKDILWSATLPNPNHDGPFSGNVNGGNYLTNFGKRDYETYIPTFPIPANVKNVRYEILLEGLEDDAPINVEFENQISPGVGVKNGGHVTLTSELFSYRTRDFTHAVNQTTLKGFKLSGLAEQIYAVTLYREEDSGFLYSHFEMELKTDNNDVRITDYPQSVQFQNGEFTFQFKARIQQNAISRWAPRLHNGFYYLNQQEYYLPSRFDAQADYDAGTHFTTEDFKVSLRAEFVQSVANIGLTALLTGEHDYRNNADRFRYFNYERLATGEWISAVPTTKTDHYERYTNLEYISPIKTLDDVVEIWNKVTWDEKLTPNETLTMEARVYDLVKGIWTDWTPILSGKKPNLVPSNLIQFKAKFGFNQIPDKPKTVTEHWQTAMDYRAIMDEAASHNVTFVSGEVRPLNRRLPAVYYTKILDYGTAVNLAVDYTSQTGFVSCSIGASQDASLLNREESFLPYSKGSKIHQFRYYRLKFEIEPENALYQVTTVVDVTPLEAAAIRFGNLLIDGVKRSSSNRYTALEDYPVSLKMDGLPHNLLPNIKTVLESCVAGSEFSLNDLYYYQFTSTNPQIELMYSFVQLDSPLIGGSLKSQINASHAPMVRFIQNETIIESIPEQFSPIVVEHELYGPLQEVSFWVDDAPSLRYEQISAIPDSKRVRLDHGDADERTITVMTLAGERTDWHFENHHLFFTGEVLEEVIISYRLRNSFMALIDESNQQTKLVIHTDKSSESTDVVDKAYVSFETNIVSNKRVLSHLSFNPLYNTRYEGFVYLSQVIEPVKTLTVSANPTHFKPRQADHVTLYIQALDRYENPVTGEWIHVNETVGVLEAVQSTTDQNGVAVFRYHSPKGVGSETLIFKTDSAVQETITIRVEDPSNRRL